MCGYAAGVSPYPRYVLVVTTETLSGYQIRSVLGEVLGVTASTRNPFAAGFRSPDGGGGAEMAQILLQTRTRAITQMMVAARRRGANAIVGMRFDNREITGPWVEICAYGTAVVVVPVTDEARQQYEALLQAGRMPHHDEY
jgi:uncharacterized protein YbjQ (UPF0145 family)